MTASSFILDSRGNRATRSRDTHRGSNKTVTAGLRARDLPTQAIEDFKNPLEVRRVLLQHAQGDFSRSALLADEMLADDRIGGCLDTRVAGLQGLPFEMKQAGGQRPNQRRQRRIAQEAALLWPTSFPLEDRINLLTSGYMLGVGLGQLIWKKTAKAWTPTLEVWHGSFIRWDYNVRAYFARTAHGEVQINPGDGQWMLFTPYGYERGWMKALVRRLAVPFALRLFGTRDLARASEVQGNPSRVGRFPRKAADEERNAFLQGLGMLATDSVIGIPVEDAPKAPDGYDQSPDKAPQYDVKLLESAARSHEVFNLLLGRADTSIAVGILGQNLTTEVTGGSYSAASVHSQVKSDIISRDGVQESTFFKSQALEPWTILNHGDSALTPSPTWDTQPPEDQTARAKTLSAVGEAVDSLETKGRMPVDREALSEAFNIPVQRDEDGVMRPLPGKPLPDDLANGTIRRDERRRALGLEPVGGARGRELLGDVAKQAPVPAAAAQREGPAAKETLLTLLSLKRTTLLQLAGHNPTRGREAKWFAKRHDVGTWKPAMEWEVARRQGLPLPVVETLAATTTPPSAGLTPAARDALDFTAEATAAGAGRATKLLSPLLVRLEESIAASTSYEDFRARVVQVYEEEGTILSEEALADVMADSLGLARLMGNHSVMEEPDEEPS